MAFPIGAKFACDAWQVLWLLCFKKPGGTNHRAMLPSLGFGAKSARELIAYPITDLGLATMSLIVKTDNCIHEVAGTT